MIYILRSVLYAYKNILMFRVEENPLNTHNSHEQHARK